MTLADIIELYSEYQVGTGGDLTDAQLVTLQTNAEARLNRLIGSRSFSDAEYEEMTAYVVLDILENKPGKGTVTEEKIKDYSWKAKVTTSSYWLDQVFAKISEYDIAISSDIDIGDGVIRYDAYSPDVIDAYRDDSGGYEY